MYSELVGQYGGVRYHVVGAAFKRGKRRAHGADWTWYGVGSPAQHVSSAGLAMPSTQPSAVQDQGHPANATGIPLQNWFTGSSQPTVCLHSVNAGKKRKCTIFDLEAHMQVETKIPTIDDILCASMSLLQLLLSRGVNIHSYSKHVKFSMDKSRHYTSASLV